MLIHLPTPRFHPPLNPLPVLLRLCSFRSYDPQLWHQFVSDGNEVCHFFGVGMEGSTHGWMDGWTDPSVEALSPGLYWVEITLSVGGCKMLRSPGRHQTGLTGVFSNLTIVSEGLFFGLLSHYAVMVAIFCLGIWLFLGGNTCQNVFESTIIHPQFVKIVRLLFHGRWPFLNYMHLLDPKEKIFVLILA